MNAEMMSGLDFFAKIAAGPEFERVPPALAVFLRDYLTQEKVARFRDRYIVNSHLPPMPGPAWQRFSSRLREKQTEAARLFSVTWAVTNRCMFNCWHCYNAGRSQDDAPLAELAVTARHMTDLGACMVHLTGGEPLLRDDLEDIARLFGGAVCVSLGTTGRGLTPARACALAGAGVFAAGISLDSEHAAEHDEKRGFPGAFQIALDGLRAAADAGLYPYLVTVASPELLADDRFPGFMRFAGQIGALEIHLLEPCPVGKLYGKDEAVLDAQSKRQLLKWQQVAAQDLSLPILSSFAYFESAEAFGCGAGQTHLYIDGSGEVCPCQLVPLSFGNIRREKLDAILARMGAYFPTPRVGCVGHQLRGQIPDDAPAPTPPELSEKICARVLAVPPERPRFFRIHSSATDRALDAEDLRATYDRVHDDYDAHWLSEAARPIEDLLERLDIAPDARIFEAGCGTGYTTVRLARRVGARGRVVAADLSEGMLSIARRRLGPPAPGVEFLCGDALAAMEARGPFDLVVSTWVLGYIPLDPFFAAARRALNPGGRVAFVVHINNTPAEALEVFRVVAAREPEALRKQVAFDFPLNASDARQRLENAGLRVESVWSGAIRFECAGAQAALDHLMKSGAGTVYYEAVAPERRAEWTRRFLAELTARHPAGPVGVVHEYIGAIAAR